MKTKWEEMLFMRPHACMHVERRERCSLYSRTSVRFVRGSLQSARWDSLFRGQLHSLRDRLGLKAGSEFQRYVYCLGHGDGIQACLLSIHRFHSKIRLIYLKRIHVSQFNKMSQQKYLHPPEQVMSSSMSICELVGLWSRLHKNCWTDFHETWMEEGSLSGINPINFWCRSG